MGKLSIARHAALFADDKLRIKTILDRVGWKDHDKKVAVYNFVLQREMMCGTSYVLTVPDKNPYIILGLSHEALALPKHGRGADGFFAYLSLRYGLGEREKLTQFVYDTLRLYAFQQGANVELRRFAFFNKDEEVLFISRYNGEVFKIDGEGVTTTRNGDGVYFADDDYGCECEQEVVVGPNGILFDTLTNPNFAVDTPSGITPEQQRRAMIVWMFCVAFPDLMPTKPLILFEGVPGAGKSSQAQGLQLALLGAKKSMIISKNKENDFGVLLLRSPIALIDNMDNYISWIPDAVAAYATSGVWPSRKLYTDGEEVTIRPQAFIAIASKNPASFRAEDVAERMVIIRLARREGFTRQEKIEANILEQRGRLLGEYLYYLNEIVKEIRAGAMNYEADGGEIHRMADFAAMARVVAKVLGWKAEAFEEEDGQTNDHNAAVTELLLALQAERDAFVNEEDPLADLLNAWLDQFIPGADRKPKRFPNVGRVMSTQELFKELETLAQGQSRQFYKTPRQLSQKLRSPHLTKEFSIITSTVRNTRAYQIARKSGLTLVPRAAPVLAVARPIGIVDDGEEEEDVG